VLVPVDDVSARNVVSVVVTGGTKGLGRGLAEAFLARGCSVTICGRHQAAVDEAVVALNEHAVDRVHGVVADVASPTDVQALWDAAMTRFGRVDVWINNAGTSHAQRDFVELSLSDLAATVNANLLGTLHGTHVALRGMRAQGSGHVFTMEGYGSDGSTQPGMSVYGATKRALRYLTKAIVNETRGGPVRVGSLSPGIVVTDLLVDVYREGDAKNWRAARWLFEVIADPVDPVAAWLADRVLAGPAHGAHVAWMTVPKAMLRMINPHYHRRGLFRGRLPEGGA
jgi:NAD(P)-dependent dehydrogenase (short-subunit alcohol dehydrogenase family)